MSYTLKLLFVLIISLCAVAIQGQENYTKVTADFESWSSAVLNVKLSKSFTAGLEQGLRLSQNSSQLDQALTEVNFAYKFFKKVELGAAFRYIYDRSNTATFDNDFRYNLDASYKEKFDRLAIKFRLRYQNKNELGLSLSEGDENKPYVRLKLSSTYNIKDWKLDPKLSSELFRSSESAQFDKVRFTVGTEYKIKKYGEIGAFYRMERELNIGLPKTTYIAGLKYTYTFKTY